MPMTLDQWKKYKGRVLIETGTLTGQAIRDALAAGFEEVRSVELSPHWYTHCVELFHADPRVKLYHGLSEEMLPEMIADIAEPVTFWLDGHYSGEGTAQGPCDFPILHELSIIGHHPVKTHTILIDDMRLMHVEDVGFSRDDIERAVLAINPRYRITYEDGVDTNAANDILVARLP